MSGVFIKVRCSSIPDSIDALLESSAVELRAQATTDQAPLAYYGTLFLDEISEVNPALQATLLRLLQEGHFCSINLKQCKLRLRLVCATTCVLEQAAERGSFRRDLLYRLNALTLRVLPLRQRVIDLPELVSYFLAQFSQPCDSATKPLPASLMHCFLSYSWPGNIRELENLMKRYVLFGCDEAVCRELLEGYGRSTSLESSGQSAVSLKELTRNAVREVERDAILKVLEANHWNRRRAACALNISYRALLYKLKDTGMAAAPAREAG
jgi:two-component system response regulator AtoC